MKRYEKYRSPSPSCSYKRQKSTSSDRSEYTDDKFSYTQYKYELNKIIGRFEKDTIVHDLDDFWLFLTKYETVKQKTGKQINTDQLKNSINVTEIPNKILKDYEHKVKILKDPDKLYSRLPVYDPAHDRRPRLTFRLFDEFIQIVKLYVDFRLKEDYKKFKKLREIQQNLPVAQYRNEIIEAVQNERVVLIAGDTGCGKSTQVPQYLYYAGFDQIACTQPRRIACISLAKRVAYELASDNENDVGYQIRFEKHKNKTTKILFITEGLLLRQLSSDSTDVDYNVIILDEIHERHLHGDFLLGVVKCLIYQKPELKVILMSATINIELFSNYFSSENAKIIQVPGRLYPIKLHYRPIVMEDRYRPSEHFSARPYIQVLQLIDETYPKTEKGDLLIFLSGLNEITTVVDAAKEYSATNGNWIILPLHSSLSLADQDKVFDYPPEGVRKCIVSTNIAETSITIDGIRFVADSGKVKEMSYDPVCRMQRLKEFWISRASAEQRKGRAGRTGPGVCFRLYSEDEYENLEPYSTPELQRVPLDSLLLQMIAMGLPDARQFPFIEPPSTESIENAILTLKHVGALTLKEELTIIGKTLSRLPIDIVLGKMLILSTIFHQVDPVVSLAAALSVQTPYTNKAFRDLDCQALLKSLESDHGDPLTLLNIYREWLEIKYKGSDNESRKWCRKRGLEEQRFYEITKLRTQFRGLLEDCSLLEKDIGNLQSSAERSIRHGELRHLRELRRNYKKSEPRKRRVLKLDVYDMANDDWDAAEDDQFDIRNVEFRLSNDSTKILKLLSAATASNYGDIVILKLIICSGLYPQVAVADEYNYCKSSNEQLFHTKNKAFIALHPMSYFGNHSEILQLHDSEIEVPPDGYYSKRPLSSKHQMLCYLSLLETTKPYLMNTIRMPIAQTLFLFAYCIETNRTFTRIVCDSWLLLEFPYPETGQVLLQKAAKLRYKWNDLINKKLNSVQNENAKEQEKEQKKLSEIEHNLESDLIYYMRTNVSYTVNRLLPADLKTLYVGVGENYEEIKHNPFQESFGPTPYRKGGMQLTENIFYNCLVETEWSINIALQVEQNIWKCENCNIEYCFSSIQKMEHQTICRSNKNNDNVEMEPKSSKDSNQTEYKCSECEKTFYLTPIEILKHKKQHKSV